MLPDGLIKRRAKKIVDAGMSMPLAHLTEQISTNDKLDALLSKESTTQEFPTSIEISNLQEFPSEIAISNLPEVQKVEVLNFPKQDAPIVNISPTSPIVNVDAPVVDIHQEEVVSELKTISNLLSKEEKVEQVKILDKDGKIVDFKQLFATLANFISNPREMIRAGSWFPTQSQNDLKGVAPLSGTSVNGTRDLTSANTWYSVPSTVPTSPYILVASIENAVGTIRFGFDGTGTPSATNGNQAPSQLTVRLTAGQVVYYASSTAGDDVNWTTKII